MENTESTSTPKTRSRAHKETVVQESLATEAKEITAKDIDPTQYVAVRNGFQGRLVYRSKRTGEVFVWDSFGSEQEMELRELRNAKNSNKNFFINNWFMFDEDWIVDYLGVRKYYKGAIKIEDFDAVFAKKPAELRKTINAMSNGQKKSLAYRAKVLIAEKQIDSLSVISVLEDCLGVELIEK